MLDLIGFD